MICFSARPAFRSALFHLAHSRVATLYTSSLKLAQFVSKDQHNQPSSNTYKLRRNLLMLEDRLEYQCIQRYRDQLQYLENESYQSYQLKDILLTENINKMWLLGSICFHNALEHIVYHAILDQKISACKEIQQALIELAQLEEFRTIFDMVAEAQYPDATVIDSVDNLYFRNWHGQSRHHRHLIICGDSCCSSNIVERVAFMKMLSQWSHPIPWKLISSKGENKAKVMVISVVTTMNHKKAMDHRTSSRIGLIMMRDCSTRLWVSESDIIFPYTIQYVATSSFYVFTFPLISSSRNNAGYFQGNKTAAELLLNNTAGPSVILHTRFYVALGGGYRFLLFFHNRGCRNVSEAIDEAVRRTISPLGPPTMEVEMLVKGYLRRVGCTAGAVCVENPEASVV
ncbi:hypothetical protein HOY82DRAFT_640217 [Tuber indicum]|nr:hypothetical protein HOY82DRAFT_649734 [Tuber indicum]KAG0138217.1 hypothetical protein HOY82DRAFT_640217 [Tuber indicum]